jgi:hypothetical protein
MFKNPRRRVLRFIERKNGGPSSALWPLCSSAVLECGHTLNLGVGTDYRPKRMACHECAWIRDADPDENRWNGPEGKAW